MRHSSARNVVERMFGILKRHFRILLIPPEYDMTIQALIPPALAALHNFIRQFDPEEIHIYDDDDDDDDDESLEFQVAPHPEVVGELGRGTVTPVETTRANWRRDEIAYNMWEQYEVYLASHGAD